MHLGLSHFVRTVCIATLMGFVGIFLVRGIIHGPRLPLTILIVSNALWLMAGAQLYRTPTVALGLVFGAISPVVGSIIVGVLTGYALGGLFFVIQLPYIFFPIGLLTGYLVYRSASFSTLLTHTPARA